MSAPLCVSLSGGCFGATLFHLGVVAALRDLGRLKDVRVISCVSGGSITGAHVVLHWDQYLGGPESFNRIAAELVRMSTVDVRGRIVRRLPRRRHAAFERCLDE